MAGEGAAAAAGASVAGGPGGVAAAASGPLQLSVGQVAFFITYLWALALYLYTLLLVHRKGSGGVGSRSPSRVLLKARSDVQLPELNGGGGGGGGSAAAAAAADAAEAAEAAEARSGGDGKGGSAAACVESAPLMGGGGEGKASLSDGGGVAASAAAAAAGQDAASGGSPGGSGSGSGGGGGLLAEAARSGLVRCVFALDPQALVEARQTLRACVEFGTIMVWFFLCDRTDLLPGAGKRYDRDVFLFVFIALTVVALGTSLQPARSPLLLNRAQTEEWKGWMQVLFLLYHYFEAREFYNAIRVFIAGYVWMTGYGNFSYYQRTGDFSAGRFCQAMWRLNFLVFFCCVVLRNEYMLYYICPMHTLFTVLVYCALALAPRLNKSLGWLWAKVLACVALVLLCWDVGPVFKLLWAPLDALVGYTDPRKPSLDRLHEWYFRSSLDRFIWVYGMACALLHAPATRALSALDAMPHPRRAAARAAVAALTCAVFAVYYRLVFVLPKSEYNRLHPYTSWVPLTCWMVLRNLTPPLRTWSARLYGWLGCVTLETYLSQFHVWLRTSVPNGQPKLLLSLVPGHPMLNFAACTALYVVVSHRLFELTNALKDVAVPHDDDRRLARNALLLAGMVGGAAALGAVGHAALGAVFGSGGGVV